MPLVGAALAALKIFRQASTRRKRLNQNTQYLRAKLRACDRNISETPGPIIRLPLLPKKQNDALTKHLLAAGIYPPFIRYGTASAQGFFRFVISSEHTREQLDTLASALEKMNR